MDDLQKTLCAIKYHSQRLTENVSVAYWCSGFDKEFHMKQSLDAYEKIITEIEMVKQHLNKVVDESLNTL
ncbi:hypothetical protein UFOVP3_61 [uncultured Caudovirales phage]|uniref:Uncharacterized protein n=1 Tax=uncultured Caudovirales phage TaxID=2100421 RepID=A0A6J5T716_9CAUD|nr:hypothetical protein UFOVP3_61 [uncultured Caudovirales phage]